ncbi:MAG: transcription-repair coupling factor, partial [Rhodothermales bacterium]|nr:transcription-repair coupling factor [Rhodothermales bacterium]
MSLSSIFAAISASGFARDLVSTLSKTGAGAQVAVRGAAGSVPAFLCAHLHLKRRGSDETGPIFALLPNADDAAYFCSDLQQILNEEDSVLLFPPSDNRPYDSEHVPDPAPVIERGDVLQRLKEGFNGILVSRIDAVFEKV